MVVQVQVEQGQSQASSMHAALATRMQAKIC